MKLFVWHGAGVLQDHTSGQITAIAPDLESAFLAIEKECPHSMGLSWKRRDMILFPPNPTDIVDLGDVTVEPRAWVTWGGG